MLFKEPVLNVNLISDPEAEIVPKACEAEPPKALTPPLIVPSD
ncbi:hypothetical protein IFVP408_C1230267 [Vibrio parahaemolyticus]